MPVIATLLYVVIAGCVIFDDTVSHISNYNGIVSGWGISAIGNNTVAVILNSTIVLLIATLLTFTASHFQLVKEKTLLPLLFFLFFQLITPSLVNQFEPTHILCFVTFMLVGILYACYQENHATEKGFIIALILSAVSFVEAHILYLLPILVVGIIQMQAASLRTFAAMIVGLITPYWIIWGLGIVELSQIDFTALAISLQMPTIGVHLIPIAVVVMIGLITGIGNMYNAFNEKIYTRATNGFINLLSTYIAILLVVDNAHYMQYLPILNGCVALQAGYYFSSHTKRTTTIVYYTLVTLLIGWIGWMYWGNYPFL